MTSQVISPPETSSTAHAPPVAVPEELNPFTIARQQYLHAARYLPELKEGLSEFLIQPDRVADVALKRGIWP